MPRPQVKMIGVTQNNLRAQLFQNVLRDGLHRARGGARHEGRRFDHAVGGQDATKARRAGLGFNSERQWHGEYGTSSVSSRAKRGICSAAAWRKLSSSRSGLFREWQEQIPRVRFAN